MHAVLRLEPLAGEIRIHSLLNGAGRFSVDQRVERFLGHLRRSNGQIDTAYTVDPAPTITIKLSKEFVSDGSRS